MKVWIVSKAIRKKYAHIHGLTEENQNVRILQPDGSYPSINTKFDVGQIWDLTFQKPPYIKPPHTENVVVIGWKFLGQEANLLDILMSRVVMWSGGPNELFTGLSRDPYKYLFAKDGENISLISIGYWSPDCRLMRWRTPDGQKIILGG